MYSIIKYMWNYVNHESEKKNNEKELDEKLAILDEEIKEEDLYKNNTRNKIETENDVKKDETIPKKQSCFRRIGIITSIGNNRGVIDYCHTFDINAANKTSEDLEEKFRVEYLAYKHPESEIIKVIKIDRILSDYWDEKPSEQCINEEVTALKDEIPEYFNTHQRSILGTIIQKNDNFMTVDTDYNKIEVDLDTISLEFLPEINDRVYLNCNVQTDTSFIDSAGEILHVLSVNPARSKTVKEYITALYETDGIIGNDYYFSFDILPSDYKPKEGDRVSAELIECDKEKFIWRCIKLVCLQRATESVAPKPIKNESDIFTNNKNGITVTEDIKFLFDGLYEEKDYQIIVTNESDRTQKLLRSAFLGKKSDSQLRLLEPKTTDSFLIHPKESRTFLLRGKSRYYGLSIETFVFSFVGFKISRKITIQVGEVTNNSNNSNLNKNGIHDVRDYQRDKRRSYELWSKKNVVSGEHLTTKPRFVKNRIGSYEVPNNLKRIVLTAQSKSEKENELEETYPNLKEKLSIHNYTLNFQILLHLEEIEYFQSMRKYDRERAHFTRENEYLTLEIENLAEKRPSLVIGDSVRVFNPWNENEKEKYYEGIIHKILYNRILLKFDSKFQTKYNGEDFKLYFYFSRSGFRKQHYAIKKILRHLGADILFPTKIKVNENLQLDASLDEDYNLIVKNTTKSVKWFNPNLNMIQKIAIKNILRGELRPMPYIVFGPPGTGKTMTLVETILQLVTLVPNSRLLVATPSNSSADLIATRLINCNALQPGDFVRLVSHNLVEKELIPDHLKPYCATVDIAEEGTNADSMIVTESGLKLKCQLKHLGRHRITIGTCTTLGTLIQLAFNRDHFTHILIDEAGQCTEPEIMIPVSLIDNTSGQIILTGDPLQLGPIILDKYAANIGLDVSFLVRILSHIPYAKNKERFPDTFGYNPRLVTKLIYNYRSIPSVLKIFNDLFYESELKPKINENDSKEIELLRNLQDILPESDERPLTHGVFFVGVRGENRQDSDSPSWYNAAEARSIFLFLIKLYKKQINAKDIGIITPYQKQVRTLRNILIEADMILPKIGSVEEFQGQERDIILISTVRSAQSLVCIDLAHALGFVQSAKRMNVAISRARSLLVIFGNPHLLNLDSTWKSLIKYCVDNDAYIGCDLPAEYMTHNV